VKNVEWNVQVVLGFTSRGYVLSLLKKIKAEFSNPENMKDAERGVALGLIIGTVFAALFTTSDYLALGADYVLNRNPYGVVWYWLNYGFWNDQSYRMYIMFFSLISEGVMWYFLVRTKRLNKFLFYAGWFQSIIWMRGSVFQNVTVTTFAPLISLCPWVLILVLLQKLPLGWSLLPWNNQHWFCAFQGYDGYVDGNYITFANGQRLILCPGGWLRWNPVYSWFWSYMMLIFWVVMPLLFYEKSNQWKHVKWILRK